MGNQIMVLVILELDRNIMQVFVGREVKTSEKYY